MCTCECGYQHKLLQIFGQKPCESFLGLKCNEFVDKILPNLKVDKEAIPHYKYHVAVLVRLLLHC